LDSLYRLPLLPFDGGLSVVVVGIAHFPAFPFVSGSGKLGERHRVKTRWPFDVINKGRFSC